MEPLAFFFLLIFLDFVVVSFWLGEENQVIVFYRILCIFPLSNHSPGYLESILHFFLKFRQLFLFFWTGFSKFVSWFLMQSFFFFFSGVSDCLLFKPLCLYHSFRYFQADMETSWVMPLAVSHHHFSKESILLKYYLPVLSYTSSYSAVCLLFSFLQWIFINILRLFYNSYMFNGHLYSIE